MTYQPDKGIGLPYEMNQKTNDFLLMNRKPALDKSAFKNTKIVIISDSKEVEKLLMSDISKETPTHIRLRKKLNSRASAKIMDEHLEIQKQRLAQLDFNSLYPVIDLNIKTENISPSTLVVPPQLETPTFLDKMEEVD